MEPQLTKQDGFTLTEAIVSVAVLSIGFVGLYAAIAGADRSLARTHEKHRLIYAADCFVETLNSDRELLRKYACGASANLPSVDVEKAWARCLAVTDQLNLEESDSAYPVSLVEKDEKTCAQDDKSFVVSARLDGKKGITVQIDRQLRADE